MILNINKPLGITSFDVIRKLKRLYQGQKIGHAGTLDPLAEGVLICLVGKEFTKRQSEFMGSEKDYEFEVLFGFSTDSFDILGLVENVVGYDVNLVETNINKALENFKGEVDQKAPKFSALKVSGKPLYRAVLSKTFDSETLPIRKVNIKDIKMLSSEVILKKDLKDKILDLLSLIKSGFRQTDIYSKWDEVFGQLDQEQYLLARFKATVSKGTYIRAIADDLGQILGVGACTLTIKRTRVGDFKVEEATLLEL